MFKITSCGRAAILMSAMLTGVAMAAKEEDPTDLKGDLPQFHIIAIDKDGDLNYPEIKQNGQTISHWSQDEYDVRLKKFESSLDVDPSLKEEADFDKRRQPGAKHDPTLWGGDYIQAMMDEIKARKAKLGDKKLQIVIHIHGGMNSIKGAVQCAAHGYWIMEKEDPTIYPIFVCWNSEPLSCYWDHLCFDRSGFSLRGSNWEPLGYLTSPFFLIGDLGAGVIRSPSIAIEQGFNDFKTVSPKLYPENLNYVPMFEQLKSRIMKEKDPKHGKSIHVMEGADNFNDFDGTLNAIKYTATLPFKALTGGLINGLGPGAWAEMKRRVDLMFWKQEQFLSFYSNKSHGNTDPDPWPRTAPIDLQNDGMIIIDGKQRHRLGGLAFFLEQLKYQVLLDHPRSTTRDWSQEQAIDIDSAKLKDAIAAAIDKQLQGKSKITAAGFDELKAGIADACMEQSSLSGNDYEVSLFGHSMGSIVINEMLTNQPDIRYKKIVYMAAACSVKDFQNSVIPYMENNPQCEFYNLCLNPEAELRNIEMNELAPRGGLLSWINDIFEQPADMRHRTYGQFITSINTSNIIPDQIRGRVYMKAFGFGTNPEPGDPHFQEGFPHNHGEFNSYGHSDKTDFTDDEKSVRFKGNRPKTANPHGFWTGDFVWYNDSLSGSGKPNPLTLEPQIDPDKKPGSPVYLKAFDKAWTDIDQGQRQFPGKQVRAEHQGTKPK